MAVKLKSSSGVVRQLVVVFGPGNGPDARPDERVAVPALDVALDRLRVEPLFADARDAAPASAPCPCGSRGSSRTWTDRKPRARPRAARRGPGRRRVRRTLFSGNSSTRAGIGAIAASRGYSRSSLARGTAGFPVTPFPNCARTSAAALGRARHVRRRGMRAEGLEPPRAEAHQDLSPARCQFRHARDAAKDRAGSPPQPTWAAAARCGSRPGLAVRPAKSRRTRSARTFRRRGRGDAGRPVLDNSPMIEPRLFPGEGG